MVGGWDGRGTTRLVRHDVEHPEERIGSASGLRWRNVFSICSLAFLRRTVRFHASAAFGYEASRFVSFSMQR